MAKTNAQQVILQLLQNAAGSWDGKTKLFQAFYFAHLYYARQEPGLLTDWPILRLPQGPGISNSAALLGGLVKNGYILVERIEEGPYPESCYRLTDKFATEPALSGDVQAAVKAAADFVLPRTASELSQLIHERSRSWRTAQDGDILDIYIDLIPDEEYEVERQKMAELDKQLTEALLDQQMISASGGKGP